jgi:hypothetical protein
MGPAADRVRRNREFKSSGAQRWNSRSWFGKAATCVLPRFFAFSTKSNRVSFRKISQKGHWVHHGTIGESRYKDAEAAKKSIAEFGYYLTGGEQAFTTPQGSSSSRQMN